MASQKLSLAPPHDGTPPAMKARPTAVLPKIISLFSGAGGLDYGFHKAGFDIAFACDSDASAVESHRLNLPETDCLRLDLETLSPLDLLTLIKDRVPQSSQIAVIGGPPCQGFSRANTGSMVDDARNTLPQRYCRILEELAKCYSISFILFENVLGLTGAKHAATYQAFLDNLRTLAFEPYPRILDAQDYGVPQRRKRLFVLATRDADLLEHITERESNAVKTVRAVLHDLPEPVYFRPGLRSSDIPFHQNHWTMNPKSSKFTTDNGHSGRSFRRLKWLQPGCTIAMGHREIPVHPEGKRRLSIFEAMKLQGFPDAYVLTGTLSSQVQQVSNAVPPPIANSIALTIKEAISGTHE